ncbi:hypothetical protein FHU30_005786 [Actinomadura rupiterrae]|nr:hypothetical protein [Actinomadura rupiterrae]
MRTFFTSSRAAHKRAAGAAAPGSSRRACGLSGPVPARSPWTAAPAPGCEPSTSREQFSPAPSPQRQRLDRDRDQYSTTSTRPTRPKRRTTAQSRLCRSDELEQGGFAAPLTPASRSTHSRESVWHGVTTVRANEHPGTSLRLWRPARARNGEDRPSPPCGCARVGDTDDGRRERRSDLVGVGAGMMNLGRSRARGMSRTGFEGQAATRKPGRPVSASVRPVDTTARTTMRPRTRAAKCCTSADRFA